MSINIDTKNLWATANQTDQAQKSSAASDFSKALADLKNPTAESAEKSEQGETKTMLQRSVTTGADGEQIVVFTLVTTNESGKILDSKVISKQKISAGTPDDAGKNNADTKNGINASNDEKNMPYSNSERARKEYENHSTSDSNQMNAILNANI